MTVTRGRIVFNDASRLKELNRIVHPCIFAEQALQIESIIKSSNDSGGLTIVVDAALMIEAGNYASYDLIMVVYCPEQVQLQRLAVRDDFSETQARQRILMQMPLIKKIGLYLDLTRRDPTKPLPDWMLKTLRFSRVRDSD